MSSTQAKFENEIYRSICAGVAHRLVIIVTNEEQCAIQTISKICKERLFGLFAKDTPYPCITWDLADGFKPIYPQNYTFEGAPIKAPREALTKIEGFNSFGVFLLKDFHSDWDDPATRRKLRNLSQSMTPFGKNIMIITAIRDIPEELKDDATIIDLPLPREQEINKVIEQVTSLKGPQGRPIKVDLNEEQRTKMINAALGLTRNQAYRAFSKAVSAHGDLTPEHLEIITDEKRQVIRESQALEFYPVKETMDDVGGLDKLKQWLVDFQDAFKELPDAKEHGVEPPKGIALIGVPGTGKSLTAKTIGSLWKLPVLRFDIGAVYGSLVGESEEKVRKALQVAETVAPCILWIDELEKALAHGDQDSGTSTRVFGTILTWFQEKKGKVFIVATANDVSKLPPEVLRKGRFDEIFFLDMPDDDERKAIFEVLLKNNKRDPKKFNLDELVKESQFYVGSEIEQAIKTAINASYNKGKQKNGKPRATSTQDIVDALTETVPLALAQKEKIDNLRRWLLEGRARSASKDLPRANVQPQIKSTDQFNEEVGIIFPTQEDKQ